LDSIDRLEFPKKYPISGTIKMAVILFIIFGVWIHNCSQNQLSKEVTISEIKITEYSTVHVEIEYTISNKSSIDRDVWLLLKVFDSQGLELGSSLFFEKAKANKIQPMLKIMDKLSRPLLKDEKPAKATIEVFKRKVI